MSFHVLSATLRATMAELLGTRFRSQDLPLIGLLGTVYWLATAVPIQAIRSWFGLPNSAGTIGASVFRDPSWIASGILVGIATVFFMEFFQVDERGIPNGLTKKAALVPVAMVALIEIGASPMIIASSGSVAYAAAAGVITCATTLATSFLLRRYRAHE